MSEERYTVWDTRTGLVVSTGSCPAGQGYRQAIYAWQQAEAGHHDYDTEYHDGTGWVPRAIMQITQEGPIVSGLPIPAKVIIEQVTYDVADGQIELDFEFPGNYAVQIIADGYQDRTLNITWPFIPTQEALNQR